MYLSNRAYYYKTKYAVPGSVLVRKIVITLNIYIVITHVKIAASQPF